MSLCGNTYQRMMTKMKLRIYHIICALCLTSSLLAEKRDCLLLHFNNGHQVVFLLKDGPKVTFEGNLVSVGTGQYQFSNIQKYIIADSESINTGIALLDKESEKCRIEAGVLYLLTGNQSCMVRLYGSDGKEMPIDGKVGSGDMRSFDLSGYASGVYLLRVDDETIKFSIK